jgi:hypothetical protein
MVKFSDDDKKVSEFSGNKYFEEGVHPVKISTVDLDKTKDGKEFIAFGVVDSMDADNEHEDEVRFWFSSPGAINFSFNRIREIFVHNSPEDKKDDTRKKFDAITDTEKLEEACRKVLIGKEAWLSVVQNPNRTYQNSAGETKNSFDKNLTGYVPTPKKLSGDAPADNTKPITVTDDDGNEQQIAEF